VVFAGRATGSTLLVSSRRRRLCAAVSRPPAECRTIYDLRPWLSNMLADVRNRHHQAGASGRRTPLALLGTRPVPRTTVQGSRPCRAAAHAQVTDFVRPAGPWRATILLGPEPLIPLPTCAGSGRQHQQPDDGRICAEARCTPLSVVRGPAESGATVRGCTTWKCSRAHARVRYAPVPGVP
jgi:hypothetical protein